MSRASSAGTRTSQGPRAGARRPCTPRSAAATRRPIRCASASGRRRASARRSSPARAPTRCTSPTAAATRPATPCCCGEVGEPTAEVVAEGDDIEKVNLASDDDGRLWVMWQEVSTGELRAMRSDEDVTAFVGVATFDPPEGTDTTWRLGGSATDDQLDVVASFTTEDGINAWHTAVLPGLHTELDAHEEVDHVLGHRQRRAGEGRRRHRRQAQRTRRTPTGQAVVPKAKLKKASVVTIAKSGLHERRGRGQRVTSESRLRTARAPTRRRASRAGGVVPGGRGRPSRSRHRLPTARSGDTVAVLHDLAHVADGRAARQAVRGVRRRSRSAARSARVTQVGGSNDTVAGPMALDRVGRRRPLVRPDLAVVDDDRALGRTRSEEPGGERAGRRRGRCPVRERDERGRRRS